MFKKIAIFFILLLITSCGPSPTRIIPNEGLFSDPTKIYKMNCTIEFVSRNSSEYQDYKFKFINGEVFDFQIDDWDPYPVNVYSFSKSHIDFGIRGDDKSLYIFDKIDGVLSASPHAHGYCVDSIGGWTYSMENNTLVYTRPWIKGPNLIERIKFKIRKLILFYDSSLARK